MEQNKSEEERYRKIIHDLKSMKNPSGDDLLFLKTLDHSKKNEVIELYYKLIEISEEYIMNT